MGNSFEKKNSELINSDAGFNFLGIKHMAQYRTKAGVSSLTSSLGFFDEVEEQDLHKIPDYILSDTLEKDLGSTINVCAMGLQNGKYLPSQAKTGAAFGAVAEDQREGVYIRDWEDFEIVGCYGHPVYTEETISSVEGGPQNRLATALSLIVRDICEDGRMLSTEWYQARIIYEYFREYPVAPENAFLISELFKELCVKQEFEGELSTYYASLAEGQKRRQKGASATRKKAEELRDYCVKLFVDLAENIGPRIMFAPAEIQAHELRKVALSQRPGDFVRSGKPYSVEWFLRNVIEDRKLEIIENLEQRRSENRL